MKDRNFQILLAPVVTEKSTRNAEQNTVTFKVTADATKPEIKAAVEAVYKVKVEKVNTVNTAGKTKAFRGMPGKRSDVRKAYVHLAAGHSIDFSKGV